MMGFSYSVSGRKERLVMSSVRCSDQRLGSLKKDVGGHFARRMHYEIGGRMHAGVRQPLRAVLESQSSLTR